MEMSIDVTGLTRDQLRAEIHARRDFGVKSLSFSLPGETAAEHLDALRRLGDMLHGMSG